MSAETIIPKTTTISVITPHFVHVAGKEPNHVRRTIRATITSEKT